MIGAEWAFVQRFICVPDAKAARMSTSLFGVLYLVSSQLNVFSGVMTHDIYRPLAKVNEDFAHC
jgi:hypothetical protein